jgi:hypothetical protein
MTKITELTKEQKKRLREVSNMKAFTFYLDDITKMECLTKLKELGVDTKKGSLSALIRVLLTEFAENDNTLYDEYVATRVQEEYLFTTKKNKRSTL